MQVGKDIMSPHLQEFSHMRMSTLDDVEYLAPRLRFEDKQEILAASGLTPYVALKQSFENSQICLTIVNPKDEPVGIFGVVDLGGFIGGIWMLGTDDLAGIQIAFLKECKKVIELLNKKYKTLKQILKELFKVYKQNHKNLSMKKQAVLLNLICYIRYIIH